MGAEQISGKAWVFGDNIDTDAIYPGQFLHIQNEPEMAQHAFEFIRPEFVKAVRPNDIIIAGKNFGCGSSREQAVLCLKQNGIAAVVAHSYARIFYRNAINCALPVLTFESMEQDMNGALQTINSGDEVKLEFTGNVLEVTSSGKSYNLQPLPAHLFEIVSHGGLIEHLKKRMEAEKSK
ncbi:MAG: 3-isopropylmalate dehydratase small subunit [Thermoplasmata archaeon]|nr:MAG: 3-isopropylmalate dehydratase small subunit [Thermoplasmata archaeon]